MPALKNAKRERFCIEYVVDHNQTGAARRAGYSEATAYAIGNTLMKIPEVSGRIAELESEILTELKVDNPSILRHWALVLTADPNELSQNRVGCCRYCYGRDGEHQWRTIREFEQARRLAALRAKLPDDATHMDDPRIPNDIGGYGYNQTLPPAEDCRECDGLGLPYQVFLDTTRLSDAGKELFRGVKVTKAGMEILMADKDKAADSIARHLGMFKADNQGALSEEAMSFITAISGGKAPLARD